MIRAPGWLFIASFFFYGCCIGARLYGDEIRRGLGALGLASLPEWLPPVHLIELFDSRHPPPADAPDRLKVRARRI
jgi:hypothetical protein